MNPYSIDDAIKARPGSINAYKFGQNIGATATEQTVWSKTGVYPWSTVGDWNDATGLTVYAVSSDANDDGTSSPMDTGARSVRVYGLGPSGVYQTEDISLNGTSQVELTKKWTRLFRAYVLTAGSSGANEGTISFQVSNGDSPETFTDIAEIDFVSGRTISQTLMSVFTVPAGYDFYLFRVDVDAEAFASKIANVYLCARTTSDGVFRAQFTLSVLTQAEKCFGGGLKFSEGTDLDMRVKWESGASGTIDASWCAICLPREDITSAQKQVALSL